ncbi:hypothetical protein ACFH04_07980 [Streptomyces noboritoensis]|uniref:Uncharacterized protein n=1 Tax=Streptomyces noboritoensis TaxID=67337 RepID=A0ABV6TET9_9ACTN
MKRETKKPPARRRAKVLFSGLNSDQSSQVPAREGMSRTSARCLVEY